MADRFRLVTIGPDGRARLELEVNDLAAGIYRERDTFTYAPAPRRERAVTGERRYQGNRVIDTAHDNATAGVTLNVSGAGSVAVAAQRVEALLERADRIADGLFVEWRPEGLPRSAFLPVRGPATITPTLRTQAMVQAGFVPVAVSWPVAPLAEGLPLDVRETWQPPADKPGGRVNLLPNPSFELAAAPYINRAQNNVSPGRVDLVAAGFPLRAGATSRYGYQMTRNTDATGVQTAYITPTAAIPLSSEVMAAAPRGLFLTAWVYTPAGQASRAASVRFGVNDHAGAEIGVATANSPTTNTAAGTWQRVTGLFPTVPAGAVEYTVRLQVIGNDAETWVWDDVDVEEFTVGAYTTATLPAYFDGDAGTGRWQGAPHTSRSIELHEDQLAEYLGGGAPAIVDEAGLRTTPAGVTGNATRVLSHRRYRHADAEVIATGRVEGTADPTFFLAPGVKHDDDGRYMWATYENNLLRIYYSSTPGNNTGLADSGAASVATPVAGRLYSVVIRTIGARIEAEFWLGRPVRGGTPLAACNTLLTDTTVPRANEWATRRGYGMPRAYIGTNTAATLVEWALLPYSYPGRPGAPAVNVLRDVPGTAPAKAEVELSTGGVTAIPFALLGWRPRSRVHNIAWNGDASVDLDAWTTAAFTGIGAGASISRVASGGPRDSAYVAVTSAAVANTGVTFRTYERLRRGIFYVLDFYAWTETGAWESFVTNDATTDLAAAAITAPAGSWTRVIRTFYVPFDRDDVKISFRHPAATAGDVLRVAGLRLYEARSSAAVETAPLVTGRAVGAGAHPPFGIVYAQAADTSATVGFASATNAGSPTGQRMRLTAPTLSGVLEFPLEPGLLDLGDHAATSDIDVEVYAFGALDAALTAPRLAVSVRAADVVAPSIYTREDGAIGKALVKPSTGVVDRTFRLGTVTLPRDPALAGRTRLRIDAALGGGTGYLEVEYLVLVPANGRAGTPTGLPLDAAYPVFLAAQAAAAAKIIGTDLRGRVRVDALAARDTGLAGAPLELPPGDVEMLAWMQEGAVPDDPIAGTLAANDATANLHVAVTPRYRLLNDD